ncbi:MAG TPA: GntP family permease [bacterium]|nr:GntP family permease [bacterium]
MVMPLIVFVLGIASIVIFVVKLELPAFVGLILSAMIVGIISPAIEFARVPAEIATNFGNVMAGIGIPILMASIVGKSLMDSGAATRIVRGFLNITGENKSEVSLLGSSYLLSIPVFFDNVFYLLAPLGRAMKARTKTKYPLYIACIAAGSLSTHMLVPPTPGPLAMASTIGVDIGIVLLMGIVVAIPTSIFGGLIYGRWIDQRMDIPLRDSMGSTKNSLEKMANKSSDELPGLFESLLPIIVPIIFVGSSTISNAFSLGDVFSKITTFLGHPAFALSAAAMLATYTLARQKQLSFAELSKSLEKALSSGGMIVAITAAGGAFGAILKSAGVGEAITGGLSEIGIPVLISAWLIAGLIRIAQGSGTVALLTTSSIMAPFASDLPFHPVYLIMAIGTGGMLFSWFNDSGYWIINKVAGLNKAETFKTWSAVNTVMAFTGIIIVMLLATILPLS